MVVIVDLPLIRTCKWTCYHIYEPGQSFDKTSNDEYFGPNLNADFTIISIIGFYKLHCFCVLIASDFYITRSKFISTNLKKSYALRAIGPPFRSKFYSDFISFTNKKRIPEMFATNKYYLEFYHQYFFTEMRKIDTTHLLQLYLYLVLIYTLEVFYYRNGRDFPRFFSSPPVLQCSINIYSRAACTLQ